MALEELFCDHSEPSMSVVHAFIRPILDDIIARKHEREVRGEISNKDETRDDETLIVYLQRRDFLLAHGCVRDLPCFICKTRH